VHVSWLSPVKLRRIRLVGTRGAVLCDESSRGDRIVLDFPEGEALETARRLIAPIADPVSETLMTVAGEFLDCIATGRRPAADGEAGRRTVTILESASHSMAAGGGAIRPPVGEGL
jgi:predicted dehydrogenase